MAGMDVVKADPIRGRERPENRMIQDRSPAESLDDAGDRVIDLP